MLNYFIHAIRTLFSIFYTLLYIIYISLRDLRLNTLYIRRNIKQTSMKRIKQSVVFIAVFLLIAIVSGYTKGSSDQEKKESLTIYEGNKNQTINLFVTHGHCSTPFSGMVENLKVLTTKREDLGNPLEGMKISFEVDPNSFNVCSGDALTARIKTPGLFIGNKEEKITFRSTNTYTMGLDWYQVKR